MLAACVLEVMLMWLVGQAVGVGWWLVGRARNAATRQCAGPAIRDPFGKKRDFSVFPAVRHWDESDGNIRDFSVFPLEVWVGIY